MEVLKAQVRELKGVVKEMGKLPQEMARLKETVQSQDKEIEQLKQQVQMLLNQSSFNKGTNSVSGGQGKEESLAPAPSRREAPSSAPRSAAVNPADDDDDDDSGVNGSGNSPSGKEDAPLRKGRFTSSSHISSKPAAFIPSTTRPSTTTTSSSTTFPPKNNIFTHTTATSAPRPSTTTTVAPSTFPPKRTKTFANTPPVRSNLRPLTTAPSPSQRNPVTAAATTTASSPGPLFPPRVKPAWPPSKNHSVDDGGNSKSEQAQHQSRSFPGRPNLQQQEQQQQSHKKAMDHSDSSDAGKRSHSSSSSSSKQKDSTKTQPTVDDSDNSSAHSDHDDDDDADSSENSDSKDIRRETPRRNASMPITKADRTGKSSSSPPNDSDEEASPQRGVNRNKSMPSAAPAAAAAADRPKTGALYDDSDDSDNEPPLRARNLARRQQPRKFESRHAPDADKDDHDDSDNVDGEAEDEFDTSDVLPSPALFTKRMERRGSVGSVQTWDTRDDEKKKKKVSLKPHKAEDIYLEQKKDKELRKMMKQGKDKMQVKMTKGKNLVFVSERIYIPESLRAKSMEYYLKKYKKMTPIIHLEKNCFWEGMDADLKSFVKEKKRFVINVGSDGLDIHRT